ncbi:MAG: DUF2752 domain-containing protein [Bacteroidetes bacterium]|nr:DUF2752 domain-containing protein [Bacteroidota bacterium]
MSVEDFMLPCFFKTYLGIECFGCGLQRSAVLLVKGNFSEAFQIYPAIYPLIGLLFFLSLHFFDNKRNYSTVIIFFGICTGLVMVISYFYRHRYYFSNY